ncbi:hypothetical protein KIW84_015190 [Lathyrus oleraceus]|uniref:DUF659 domain-containing protein n=1 Tax=Pisum sativum TaxID=3888 RepID=A0A9D5H014_PEA|nr:hypothetical protein KIW84_015190 [Pisum sativum]
MVEKEGIKRGIEEVLMQLDADDTNEIEEISRIRSGKRLAETSSMVLKRTKGPLNLVFKKTKKTSINVVCDKEERARIVQYIAHFDGSYGPHLKPPSFHELKVPLLHKELEYTKGLLKNHKMQKNKYGCSIMSDGWTYRKGRTLINFLANCLVGTMFVKSVDASDYAKTEDKLAELLDTFVEQMGEQNVVQLITDNGSNYVAVDKILTSKRPTHVLDSICNPMYRPYVIRHRKNSKGSKCGKDAKGKRATSIILMALFFSDVVYTLKNDPKLVKDLCKCIETLSENGEVEDNISVQLAQYKVLQMGEMGEDGEPLEEDLVHEDDDLTWAQVAEVSGVNEHVIYTRRSGLLEVASTSRA